MRRKPQNNGSYNQNRNKPRFGGQGGGHHQGHHHGGPRKNYAATREKYLAQARDALAAGDRVLAENYYQHADHCYRMMVEEGYYARNNAPVQQGENQSGSEGNDNGNGNGNGAEDFSAENTSQLPSFITATPEQPQEPKPVDPTTIQNWEERDS